MTIRNSVLAIFVLLVPVPPVAMAGVEPAPPLTDAQIAQLRLVPAWDFVFTFTRHAELLGNASTGELIQPLPVGTNAGPVTGVSFRRIEDQRYSSSFTVAGAISQSACSSRGGSNKCVPKFTEYPASFTLLSDSITRTETVQFAGPGCPDGLFSSEVLSFPPGTLTGAQLESPYWPLSNSYFFIDYATNPPTAELLVRTAGMSGEDRFVSSGCLGNTESVSAREQSPPYSQFFLGEGTDGVTGDTQVRVEDVGRGSSRFVIRGSSEFRRSGTGCDSIHVRCDSHPPYASTFLIRAEWVATVHDPAIPRIHSVEVTQATQEWQTLGVLKADLLVDGAPPIPIVAKKPVAVRVYPDQVPSDTSVTIEVSGHVNGSKVMTLQPHCTPELRRRMEQGCVSANFYFTPPVGDWSMTVKLKTASGDVLESHDLNLTSKASDTLVLKAVSVCDAVDATGNWLCGSAQTLSSIDGLLSQISPTDEVRVEITGHQVRRNSADYDADRNGSLSRAEALKWWTAVLQDILKLFKNTDYYEELIHEQHHYYGMMRPNAPGPAGAAFTGKRSAASKTFVTTLGTVNWTQYVVAHETTHMLGRDHTSSAVPGLAGSSGCWGPGAAPQDWPYADNLLRSGPAPGTLQVGFDVINGAAVLPENNFEIAAYCSHGWISPYGYLKLLERLDPPPPLPPGVLGTYWRVAGTISEGAAVLEPLYTLDLLGDMEPGTGTHRIEVLDGSNGVLYTRYFTLESVHISPEPGDPNTETDLYFAELVPVRPGAATITVVDAANASIGSVSLGGQAPIVTVTSPAAGSTLSGLHAITWTVEDEDSTIHTFEVDYSSDGGTNWRSVGAGLLESALNVDFDALAGSAPGAARVQVIASDGVNTGVGTSDDFTVTKKEPSVEIILPSEGASLPAGSLVLLRAVGFDTDDGLLTGGAMQWSSDIDGALGNGDSLPVYGLSPEKHVITVMVTDQDGNSASDQITIAVFDAPTADVDSDDDVDLSDFRRFAACLNGPRATPDGTPCDAFDFDRDGDVDAPDFAALQRCFSGENMLADPKCAR